jgi:hypothetical protein
MDTQKTSKETDIMIKYLEDCIQSKISAEKQQIKNKMEDTTK